MNKATKAISLVRVRSGAALLGDTAFAPRSSEYYGPDGYASDTQPSSYQGSRGGHRGGYFFVPSRFGRGSSGSSGTSGYRGLSSSGSSGHSSGGSHSSGVSRGGFGSSGHASS